MHRVCAPAKNKKRGLWRNPEKLRRNDTPLAEKRNAPSPFPLPPKGERTKTTNVSLQRERPNRKTLSLRERVG
jgi:hypothetical protein